MESSLRFLLAATEQFLDEVQSGEIYIGMIALRQLPRYEVRSAGAAAGALAGLAVH